MPLMSFNFTEFHAKYLRNVVKGSSMSMTDYIQSLIDSDIDASGEEFTIALVLQGNVLKFCTKDEKPDLIVGSVTGDPILAFITDNQSSELVSAFKLIMSSPLTETVVNLDDDGSICWKTKLLLVESRAAEDKLKSFFDFDIRDAIFK